MSLLAGLNAREERSRLLCFSFALWQPMQFAERKERTDAGGEAAAKAVAKSVKRVRLLKLRIICERE